MVGQRTCGSADGVLVEPFGAFGQRLSLAGSRGRLNTVRAGGLADAGEWVWRLFALRRRPRWSLVWVVIEQAESDRAAVDLLADRMDLVEAVTDLRWLEWGHPPEPTDRDWWRAATVREAGRSQLPVTWVTSDDSGALVAVGLGQFDIEERRDRSPWVLGMIVRRDRRGTGLGRLCSGTSRDGRATRVTSNCGSRQEASGQLLPAMRVAVSGDCAPRLRADSLEQTS